MKTNKSKSTILALDKGLQLHGPAPDKWGNLSGPCNNCPALTPEEVRLFEEVKQLLLDIHFGKEPLSRLDALFSIPPTSEDNPYLDILNCHNSGEEGGCDTLLHHAADISDYGSMKILLNAGSNPNALNRWNQLPLHTVVDEGDGCHCPACNKKNLKCVKLLLQYGSETNVQDWEADTPLACSAVTLMDDCARILWERGASIHIGGNKGKAGELVASYIPDEVCHWMNEGIVQHETERLQLELDFGVIIGKANSDNMEDKRETQFLMYMTKAHRKAKEKLLEHPLVQAYVYLKWETVSLIFAFLRLAYLGSALLYTCFIISYFLYNCPYEEALGNATTDDGGESGASDGESFCEPTPWIYTLSIFLICFVVCMVLNEVYEIGEGLWKYFTNGLNYGWLLMIVTVTLNVLPVFVHIRSHWQYIVAAFGVFLAWGMFLTQLARHPKIGIYIEMLGRIVTEFMVFSATYFALIVGFALGFAVLFPQNPMFEYVYGFLPFVKILLMMNGEFDYETLFDEKENPRSEDLEYAIGAHIIFVGFVIIVTILLSNLLLGLAISDVQELRVKAKLSRTERLIQQIHLMETLFKKPWVPVFLKDWYIDHFSIKTICEDEEEHEHHGEEDDNDGAKIAQQNPGPSRVKGPYYKGFQPLRNDEKALPEDLREQFISFVDTDACSKEVETEAQKEERKKTLCNSCAALLKNIMVSTNTN